MNWFLKFYYVVLIYAVFGEHFFKIPAVTIDILAMGFIILSSYEDKLKLKLPRRETIYFLNSIVVTAVAILIYSLITQLIYTFSADYLKHTVTLCIRLVLYSFCGLRVANLYKGKSINLLLISCIVAYIPAIIRYFIDRGFISGIIYLFVSNTYTEQVALEVHRLTYVFGFITLYFFYQKFVYKQKVTTELIVSLIFTIIGLKRVVYLALALAMLIVIIIRRMKEKTIYRLLCISSFGMVVFALLYIYFIKSGLLEQIFDYFNLEDSFRFNFWNYISSKYGFSPGFFGYGISYPHRVMWHEWSNIKGLSSVTNLHNDILGYYLGLGFWGFILFWIMYFYGQVRIIKNHFSIKVAAFCFVLSFYYFIIMMTSNEGLPGFLYGLYYMVIAAAIAAEKTENTFKVTV